MLLCGYEFFQGFLKVGEIQSQKSRAPELCSSLNYKEHLPPQMLYKCNSDDMDDSFIVYGLFTQVCRLAVSAIVNSCIQISNMLYTYSGTYVDKKLEQLLTE